MSYNLVVQVLGNSDVNLNGKKAADELKTWECSGKEELQEIRETIEVHYRDNIGKLDFPMVRLLNQKIQERDKDAKITFCFLLTNQEKWLKELHNDNPDMWREFGHTDGSIWRNLLEKWCSVNQIDCIFLDLELDSQVKNGVADWEEIAPKITELLNRKFLSQEANLYNNINNSQIDNLVIQHSSGTPALCSALYLWGIEQKLANQNVEFIYISRESVNRNEDSLNFHKGSHWQGRLVAPQIKQLLELQDFSGACSLVNSSVFKNAKDLQKKLKKLDRLISFNLIDIKHDISLNEQVIERIAIALWSEEGFRQRGQWMHWILRMSGAFELVCNHYLAQTQSNWYWQEKEIGISIWHQDIPSDAHFYISITQLVKKLLTKGEWQGEYKSNERPYSIKLKCEQIRNYQWHEFVDFYCGKGWQVSKNLKLAFSEIRNALYHNLMGDKLDQALDAKTNDLAFYGGVSNENHPAQVAVQQLRTLLEITNLWEVVDTKVKKYQSDVKSLKEAFLK